jgi:uncharacterized protein (DUF58 family)
MLHNSAEQVAEDSGPVLGIELSNVGTLNKTGLILEVHLWDESRQFSIKRSFLVEALPSGGRLASELTLRGLARGSYTVRELRVVGSDVLGLFRAFQRVRLPRNKAEEKATLQRSEIASLLRRLRRKSNQVAEQESVLVGPETVALQRGLSSGHSDASGSDTTSSDLLGHGDEMRGTRPYVAGDDLRSVHWKSTARLGRLVVREFDRTTRAESVVIWDGGLEFNSERRSSNRRAKRQSRRDRRSKVRPVERGPASPMEQGLRLVASLCRAIEEQGRPCALLRLDGSPLWMPPPRRTAGSRVQTSRFVDALALADASRTGALPDALGVYLKNLPAGAEVFLVTAASGDVLRRAVHAMERLGLHTHVAQIETATSNDTVTNMRLVKLPYREPKRGTNPEEELIHVRDALVALLDSRPRSSAPSSNAAYSRSHLGAQISEGELRQSPLAAGNSAVQF